jgi:hypothetical protein
MNFNPYFNPAASVGDIVSVQKGLFTHVGVVVHGGILQNRPGGHESIISWQEFASGQRIAIQRMGLDEGIVMAHVRAILASPRAYNAAFQNCEHTVSQVTRGKAESPQFGAFAVAALIGLVFVGALSE